jgi:TPR repeat protein
MNEMQEFLNMPDGDEKIKRMIELDEQGAFESIADKSLAMKVAEIIYMTGLCYEGGVKIEESPEKAFACYKVAAKIGYAAAQCSVAEFYEYGECVEQSLDEAKRWYSLAAAQGDEDAKDKLKELSAPLN